LFLDEIQKSPKAFMLLRYFYEKHPEIPVIAAGSLLEFIFDQPEFSAPVGRIDYYHLGPMNFIEFLWACGEDKLVQNWKKNKGHTNSSNFDVLQKRLHQFIFVGGMPEAILKFSETENPKLVRKVHQSIIQTYADDFPKYTKKTDFEKVSFEYTKIHHMFGRKMKYSELSSEYRSAQIKVALELLEKARVILRCFHTNASAISLVGTEDASVYKCYDLDVGLLSTKLNIALEDIIHLNTIDSPIKGLIYKQFIAQHLAYFQSANETPTLYYWLRDKKSESAELDFVIQMGQRILPVEVKSAKSSALRSLNQFMGEKSFSVALRLDASDLCLTEPSINKDVFYYAGLRKEKTLFKLNQFHLTQVVFLEELLK
jgi:predicted AAA+ superfamily ATPase